MKISDEEQQWLDQTTKRNAEAMKGSSLMLQIFTENIHKESVPVLQFGLAVLMDKPIYIVARRNAVIPENVKKVARLIEYFDESDPESLHAATKRILTHAGKIL